MASKLGLQVELIRVSRSVNHSWTFQEWMKLRRVPILATFLCQSKACAGDGLRPGLWSRFLQQGWQSCDWLHNGDESIPDTSVNGAGPTDDLARTPLKNGSIFWGFNTFKGVKHGSLKAGQLELKGRPQSGVSFLGA